MMVCETSTIMSIEKKDAGSGSRSWADEADSHVSSIRGNMSGLTKRFIYFPVSVFFQQQFN